MLTGMAELGSILGALTEEKNRAYGDSFANTGNFLRLLYPDGISPFQYDDALCIVRIFDKLARIATARDAFGESPYNDIVGYGILGSIMSQQKSTAAVTPVPCIEVSYSSYLECTAACCLKSYKECTCNVSFPS